jgi:hypothetical protein
LDSRARHLARAERTKGAECFIGAAGILRVSADDYGHGIGDGWMMSSDRDPGEVQAQNVEQRAGLVVRRCIATDGDGALTVPQETQHGAADRLRPMHARFKGTFLLREVRDEGVICRPCRLWLRCGHEASLAARPRCVLVKSVGPWSYVPDVAYKHEEAARASTWKQSTPTLPEIARVAAPYVDKSGLSNGSPLGYCLPVSYADLNLLPEVRVAALALFAKLGIAWHAAIGDGPSNNLLSSQVQCVNALGQMMGDPDRIVQAFGGPLATTGVRQIEPGRFLTFEYIGPTDFFGESPNRPRVRGAGCTSVDAAFVHETAEGAVELVLLEWKYTEQYLRPSRDPRKDRIRADRYEAAWSHVDGPVRSDVLAFVDILDEPFYQLVRQQLLAHELEMIRAEGADRVRVVHIAPQANIEYQRSLPRAVHKSAGETVAAVWASMLRRPDRFLSVESSIFLDPAVTSADYVHRYSTLPRGHSER